MQRAERLKPFGKLTPEEMDGRVDQLWKAAVLAKGGDHKGALAPRDPVRYYWHNSKIAMSRVPLGEQPFEIGTNGLEQRRVQYSLYRQGLLTKEGVDGSWGPNSATAWQQKQWLESHPQIRYKRTDVPFTGLENVSYKIGDKGPGVEQAIRALSAKGYYHAKVNQYWGIAAQDAYDSMLADTRCASKESDSAE
ncbi:MAG: hypothetical protein IPK13_13240 [Deltaproteobacteria bacterium]|nr:hypothetical protein [Deltaproteobacteria bacterium]